MVYLVSGNQELFESPNYEMMSPDSALREIMSWDVIQFDTETSGRNPHLCKVLCAQFGNKKRDMQIVVDCLTVNLLMFKEPLETKLLIGVNLKFDYQFLFQYKILPTKTWDCMVAEQVLFLGYDPKYFHCSLKALCDRRLGIDIDKTTRGEIIWRGLDDKVILYAAGDVQYLEDIYEQQLKEAKQKKVVVAIDIENRFVIACAYLEWCGIRIDVNKWKIKMADNDRKITENLKKLNDWVESKYKVLKKNSRRAVLVKEDNHGITSNYKLPKGTKPIGPAVKQEAMGGVIEWWQPVEIDFPFVSINRQGDLFSGFDTEPHSNINWSSSKDVIAWLKFLGFDTKVEDKKTGESKDSAVEKHIKKQKGIADDFLKVYFAYKGAEKDASTYGQCYIDAINPVTGRIHTTFKQLGASSGRMSCGGGSRSFDTDLAKYKGIPASRCKYVQLQNLPADDEINGIKHYTRTCFIPNEGNLMCSADFSALESRLGADIYNEKEMLEEFLHRSGDMHSLCAKIVFHEELKDVPIEQIKDVRPDLRKKVKPIEFSQQFGGGGKAVADALGCSMEEASKFVKAYADGFKGISEFKQKGSRFVRNNGYVLICKRTGIKLWWEDWKKWREMEDLPEELQRREYTSEERKIHNTAGAKWDRMALNSPTQGTGAEIIKLATIMFFWWLVKEGYFNQVLICDMVHDEIVVEFPAELKDIVPPMLKKCMEKAAAQLCTSLPIPAVPETGDHWIH